MDMKRKPLGPASILLVVALAACSSGAPVAVNEPEPQPAEVVQEPAAEPVAEPLELAVEEPQVEAPAEEVPFDPSSITKEIFDTTKTDVQALIGKLNEIIREKDYDVWVTYLGASYRTALSDPAFLKRISESSVLKKQGVTLRELRDYFLHVVVPSRANDRVDDIEFIGQNRVKAFTVDAKGRRLRLYDLEKAPSGWKIVN
jgi:hypothetical protein